MSDIDRLFARFGRGQPAASEERELRSVPCRGRAAGSRVVEVVSLPARGASPGHAPSDRPGARVRALTWEDGFPAKSAPPPSPAPQPVPAEMAEPIAHVMPMRERTVVEPPTEPAPPA
jgi:hypothetical protein